MSRRWFPGLSLHRQAFLVSVDHPLTLGKISSRARRGGCGPVHMNTLKDPGVARGNRRASLWGRPGQGVSVAFCSDASMAVLDVLTGN